MANADDTVIYRNMEKAINAGAVCIWIDKTQLGRHTVLDNPNVKARLLQRDDEKEEVFIVELMPEISFK